MAVDALDRVTVVVERKAFGPQGHTLIDANPVADDRGLADHHTGAVIDEDPLADSRARVNVDTGLAVGVLGDDARDQRHVGAIEDVGDAVAGEGEDPRVAEDGFRWARGRRVALVGGDRVEGQLLPNLGQTAQEVGRDPLCLPQTCLGRPVDFVPLAGKAESTVDLVDHDQ